MDLGGPSVFSKTTPTPTPKPGSEPINNDELINIELSIKKKIDGMERNKRLLKNIYTASVENFNIIKAIYSS